MPFHPGRWWVHCRIVFIPMSYLYGVRFTAPEDPLILSLREVSGLSRSLSAQYELTVKRRSSTFNLTPPSTGLHSLRRPRPPRALGASASESGRVLSSTQHTCNTHINIWSRSSGYAGSSLTCRNGVEPLPRPPATRVHGHAVIEVIPSRHRGVAAHAHLHGGCSRGRRT